MAFGGYIYTPCTNKIRTPPANKDKHVDATNELGTEATILAGELMRSGTNNTTTRTCTTLLHYIYIYVYIYTYII